MKRLNTLRRSHTAPVIGSLLLSALVLAACGGGGGDAGSATTASNFSAGTITGFGSVIVNGVRYDDSSATVNGEDDSNSAATSLKIGMQVEVESEGVTCSTDATGAQSCVAKAGRISHGGNSMVGPVDAGSLVAGSSFTLLGQKVLISSSTTFNYDSSGLTALADGVIVEVHGAYDKTTGETSATRIEVKAVDLASYYSGATDTDRYRLRGVVAAFNSAARTATIGGQPVHFDAALDLSTLADGQVVRVRIIPAASGTLAAPWEVDKLKSAERKLSGHKGAKAELEGAITDYALSTDGLSATFKIDGNDVSVVLASVTFADGASAADLQNGSRIEVEGSVDATTGVLAASKIELKKAKGKAEKVGSFEFHGLTSAYDAATHSFKLRGETIVVDANTAFVAPLTEAALSGSAGVRVEVKGVRSADGTSIVATRIKQEN